MPVRTEGRAGRSATGGSARRCTALLAGVVLGFAACRAPAPRLTEERRAVLARANPPPSPHLPYPPERLERMLWSSRMTLRTMKPAGAGVMGVAHATVSVEGARRDVEIKWKTCAAGDADGWNNSPRKEIAAWEVQRWFLDPDDFVVPPTALRCVPLDDFRRFEADAQPTVEGTRCVLGMVSAWLQDVRVPETLYEPDRFAHDPRYAYHMANFNLLLYLVDHRDGRAGNFLEATDPTNRQVFSVDNGIAFGGLVYNFLVPNWGEIRVPALRRAAVEHLRTVRPQALDRLATVVEMRADGDGVLRPTAAGPVADPSQGSRVGPGWIQQGLTAGEIDAVAERVRRLLARVDAGEIAVF